LKGSVILPFCGVFDGGDHRLDEADRVRQLGAVAQVDVDLRKTTPNMNFDGIVSPNTFVSKLSFKFTT
jgi:hypothetical protein